MKIFPSVVAISILVMTGCGGGDGGGSATTPIVSAPLPTPTPLPSTPAPTPAAQNSFPLTSPLRFSTLFARLSYLGLPGQSALSDLRSIGALPGGSIIPSPDALNGVHQIEEDFLIRAGFATNLRQGQDVPYVQVETYGRPGDGSLLRLLNNSIKPINGGTLPLVLRYTSFASWTRQAQPGEQTATSWHVFGFRTPASGTPTGTRRFEVTAAGDYIVTTTDGKGIPYSVDAFGGFIVDFDRRVVNFDNLQLVFRGQPGTNVGDILTAVTGTGSVGADGSLSGSFGTVPPIGMSGMPSQSFAAVQFAGHVFGPDANEVGLVLTFVDPERADRSVRRGYGAGVLVGRPVPGQ